MRFFFFFFFLTAYFISFGQEENVFSFSEYVEIVRENHPIAYQAKLVREIAEANEMIARGGFDPKLLGAWDKKSYDEKNYFSVFNGNLKIPTWFGAEAKAGYNRNNGEFLNASDFLPEDGLLHTGVSIPLGRGLIIDDRRAELKKAEIFIKKSEQEQELILNELIYNSAKAYIAWYISNRYAEIAKEGLQLAEARFFITKGRYFNGDLPGIDTLEALILVQTREIELRKAEQKLENGRFALDYFLWMEGTVPLEIKEDVKPSDFELVDFRNSFDSLSLSQNTFIERHPYLELLGLDIDELDLKERLLKEDRKPDLRLEYSALLAPQNQGFFDDMDLGDHKIALSFSYPILQRKERGKLLENDLKRQQTNLELALKKEELEVAFKTYRNNIEQAETLLVQSEELAFSRQKLLEAENLKFGLGESSQFLVNSREAKYLESRQKMIMFYETLVKNYFGYFRYSNVLYDVL